MTKNTCNILLDSGAFSFWRRDIDIPISEYIEYCKRHAHEVDAYVCLDTIPGKNGKMDHSQASIEISAAKSYDNLQAMKSEGLSPIPVFHQGERFEWLDKMLEDGETYIGISPYLRSHQSEIISWMDKCYSRITDSKGRPLVKTHGFGVTASVLCHRFPFYSVDSTSWSVGGGYGQILMPHYKDDKPDYSKPPQMLKISARKTDQSNGFDGLSQAQQDRVIQHADRLEISMGELRNAFMGRWRFNVDYYINMAKSCDGRLFENKVRSMFGASSSAKQGYQPEPLKMYFATVIHTNHHNQFLNAFGIKNRLLSYAFLKDERSDFLADYIKTGLPDITKPKPRKASLKSLKSEAYRVRRSYSVMEKLARNVE